MKRFLALFLSAMLCICAFGAWADDELSEYSKQIDLTVDYPVFMQEDISFPLVETPVTVSVLFPRTASHAEDFSDIWWTKYVAELTGITFDFKLVENSVWEERKNLAFMSGVYKLVFITGLSGQVELHY